MAYIPYDKIKSLREAAKKGDQRARKILIMQMDGNDFSSLLEEYFSAPQEPERMEVGQSGPSMEKPATEPTQEFSEPAQDPKLEAFLRYNGVKKGDVDYDETVEAYYKEFPKARPHADKPEQINIPNDDDGHSIYGEDDEPIDDGPVATDEEEKSFIDALIEDEIEAIDSYNKAIMEVMNLEQQSDTVRKGLIADFEEIKKDEIEHLEKLRRIKASIEKKEESSDSLLIG